MKTIEFSRSEVTQHAHKISRTRASKRLEARVLRFFGESAFLHARIFLALIFVFLAIPALFATRASIQNSPLDFLSQALSILSVGHVTFANAPHLIGALEVGCAVAILVFPFARTTVFLIGMRLVLGILPLVMLRDDLWRTAVSPTVAGLGVIYALFPAVWALGLTLNCRWNFIESDPETDDLLEETLPQIRAREQAWRRAFILGLPLLIVGTIGVRAFWPHYLTWFHARQEAAALDEHLAGQLIKKSMPPSPLLGGRKITTWVYLPPGYDKTSARYPVVYVMHGMPGEVRDCFVKGEVQDDAEKLIQSRQVRPFIIVGWDAQGPGGPDDVTDYLDRPGYQMESFMVEELVPYIDKTYRTIPKPEARALDGISAGGYGAANLMLKYPNIWKIGASHSGFFEATDDTENMTEILGPKSKKWDQNDPMQLADTRSKADNLHFYGDIGDGDDLQSEFVDFGKKLSANGIQNEMHIYPGRHTWAFWSQRFKDSFRFDDKWFKSFEAPGDR